MGGQAELSSLPIRNDSNVNMAGDKECDIRVVTAKFSEAKSADGCVHLRPYIDGYRELLKFITLFGSVFSFVTSDVTDKLAILEKFLSAEPEQYETVNAMVAHELGPNKAQAKKPKSKSGSRTLLRLHRALDFIA